MGGTWSGWADTEKTNFVDAVNGSSRRPNVLLVGKPGAGKSSLATTLESALTEKPAREVASAGRFESGKSFTFRLRRFQLFRGCGSLNIGGRSISNIKDKVPIVYDMPGLQNVDDERVTAILRCIIKGRVPSDEQILVSAGMTGSDIYQQFHEKADESDHRIDRIIFVHSKTEAVPDNLIKAVLALCDDLDVTLFSVLSHYDAGNEQCSYADLSLAVGTAGSPRGCEVQLYHRAMARDGRYKIDHRTNYFILLLWQSLINEHYPIHSTQ